MPTVLGLATSGYGLYRISQDDDTPAVVADDEPGFEELDEPDFDEPDEPIVDDETTTTEGLVSESAASCSSSDGRFGVEYPSDWYTASYEGGPTCTMFHPEPFDPAEAEGGTPVAIQVEALGTSYSDWIASIESGEVVTILEREETTVGGRPAVRYLFEYVDSDGVRAYEYAVDLDGEAFVLHADEDDSLDFDESMAVLDEMAESIEFV